MDPIRDKKDTQVEEKTTSAELKPTKGGWLSQQWRDVIVPFGTYVKAVGLLHFPSYSKEKIMIASKLAGNDDFEKLLIVLSNKNSREMKMITAACEDPTVCEEIRTANPGHKATLIHALTFVSKGYADVASNLQGVCPSTLVIDFPKGSLKKSLPATVVFLIEVIEGKRCLIMVIVVHKGDETYTYCQPYWFESPEQ